MNTGTRKNGETAFTLVELLVVVAIIGILAGIVVPNVTRYIRKGRVAAAVSEIKGMETALTGMLTDAGRSRFTDFLNDSGRMSLRIQRENVSRHLLSKEAIIMAEEYYTTFFYELLRQGSGAEAQLDDAIRGKLGTSYMDLGLDPWGNKYRFYMGPLRGLVFHRSYRLPTDVDDAYFRDHYVWDTDQRNEARRDLPGQPQVDKIVLPGGRPLYFPGYPAPRDLPVFIYSLGPNATAEAIYHSDYPTMIEPDFFGGGDDINNWDNESGWESAPQ